MILRRESSESSIESDLGMRITLSRFCFLQELFLVQEQVIQRSILLAYFRENEIYISVIRDALYFPFVHRAKDEGLASFSMTQQLFIMCKTRPS